MMREDEQHLLETITAGQFANIGVRLRMYFGKALHHHDRGRFKP
jgi:hypothetical protein